MRLSTCAQRLLEETMRFDSQGQVRDLGHNERTQLQRNFDRHQDQNHAYHNHHFYSNNNYFNGNNFNNNINYFSNSHNNNFNSNNINYFNGDFEKSHNIDAIDDVLDDELPDLKELFCLEMSSNEDKLPLTSRVRPSSSSMSPPYMSRPTRLCSTDSIRSSTSGGSTLQETLAEFQELQQRQQQQAPNLEEQDTEAVMAELRSSMDPAMISLAFQEARREIDAVSTLLDISSDPSRWSRSDFFAWLRSTLRQQDFASAVVCEENLVSYCFDASTLTKQDFHLILPLQTSAADVMFAKLEIWRNAFHQDLLSTTNPTTNITCSAMTTITNTVTTMNTMNITTTSASTSTSTNTCTRMNMASGTCLTTSSMNSTNTCAMHPTSMNPATMNTATTNTLKTCTMTGINTMNPTSMNPTTMNPTTMNTCRLSAPTPNFAPSIPTSSLSPSNPPTMSPTAMPSVCSPSSPTKTTSISTKTTSSTTGTSMTCSSDGGQAMEFDSELSLLMEGACSSSLPNSWPSMETEDSEETLTSCSSTPSTPTTPTSPSSRSTNVHLWQFVKELLKQPEQFSDIIRWIDRDSGVFKIVDSQKVANLWGKRKNRPAMNYDKLSRSLRQYYKKGIMKKTERTQRLVYQFCPPYHL